MNANYAKQPANSVSKTSPADNNKITIPLKNRILLSPIASIGSLQKTYSRCALLCWASAKKWLIRQKRLSPCTTWAPTRYSRTSMTTTSCTWKTWTQPHIIIIQIPTTSSKRVSPYTLKPLPMLWAALMIQWTQLGVWTSCRLHSWVSASVWARASPMPLRSRCATGKRWWRRRRRGATKCF